MLSLKVRTGTRTRRQNRMVTWECWFCLFTLCWCPVGCGPGGECKQAAQVLGSPAPPEGPWPQTSLQSLCFVTENPSGLLVGLSWWLSEGLVREFTGNRSLFIIYENIVTKIHHLQESEPHHGSGLKASWDPGGRTMVVSQVGLHSQQPQEPAHHEPASSLVNPQTSPSSEASGDSALKTQHRLSACSALRLLEEASPLLTVAMASSENLTRWQGMFASG